jgi:hypothetical protein
MQLTALSLALTRFSGAGGGDSLRRNLETEDGFNLLIEDGFFLLLEG